MSFAEEIELEEYTSDQPPLEPVGVDEACEAPLHALPRMIRTMADEVLRLKQEWQSAYGNYRERKASLSVYFHTDEGLGITAAEAKASSDPSVVDASAYSMRLRLRIAEFENAEQHLKLEFQVRMLEAGSFAIATCGPHGTASPPSQ